MDRIIESSVAREALILYISKHYLTNDTIFGKRLLNIKNCFDFLYNF
jgi:hypothetical protein